MDQAGQIASATNPGSSSLLAAGPESATPNPGRKFPASVEVPTVELVASKAHQAVDKVAQAAAQAAQVLDEKGRQLKETQFQVVEKTRSYVQAHPGTSIGVAVAAGFLIRHLLRFR